MPRLKPFRGLQIDWNHPLARGLAGCWLLNEGAGERTADCGLRRKTGSFQYSTAAPLWQPGKHGSAIEFGAERYIHCGTHKFGWDLTNEISIVALVNHGANQTNMIFARSAFIRPCVLSGYAGGKFKWQVNTDGTDCSITSTSSHATNSSEWVHVAGTWRAGNGRLYVNGVREALESASTGSLSFVNDSQPVGIGGTYEAGSYYYCWSGRIEYVFVYNRALRSEEVQWLSREAFAFFERPISRESLAVPAVGVSLAGSAAAQSAASATLESIGSLPEMQTGWLRDALFNGMSANAFKLGTTLSLGWFWVRVTGCAALHRGPGIEQIDFVNVLTVAEQNAPVISPPRFALHEASTTYVYVLRRFNNCGYQELTLAATAKVSFDASGEPAKARPNMIFALRGERTDANKVRLIWFYCPLEQQSLPVCFKIYYDGGTGQIDYETPLAAIGYQGQKFYSFQSTSLQSGRYLFAIRAEDAAGTENSSCDHLTVELAGAGPDPIEVLQAQTV